LQRFAKVVLAKKAASASSLEQWDAEISQQVAEAGAFAEAAADAVPEQALENVYR
jgi:TPP-dependent pyruvate/acetoin dehydrogenase alpha subunit